MKKLKVLMFVTFLVGFSGAAFASDDHNLMEACKTECPNAKNEHESHACMKGVVKNKKSDKKFRKSDCYEAFREHEKHEKDDGHKH